MQGEESLDITEDPRDHLADYLAIDPPSPPQCYIDLYRIALTQWKWLTQSALYPVEQHVHTAYHSVIEAAQREYKQRKDAIQSDFDTRLAQCDQVYRDAMKKLHAESVTRRTQIKQQLDNQVSRFSSTAEARLRDARQDCEYEQLTADTVAEAARKECNARRQYLNAALPRALAEITEVRNQAQDILQRYGRTGLVAVVRQSPHDSTSTSADADHTALLRQAQDTLHSLYRLILPKLLRGPWPWLLLLIPSVPAAVAGYFWGQSQGLHNPIPYYVAAGAALAMMALLAGGGRFCWTFSGKRITLLAEQIARLTAQGKQVAETHFQNLQEQLDDKILQVEAAYRDETQRARDLRCETEEKVSAALKESTDRLQKEANDRFTRLQQSDRERTEQTRQEYENLRGQLIAEKESCLAETEAAYQSTVAQAEQDRSEAQQSLQRRWRARLELMSQLCKRTAAIGDGFLADWQQLDLSQWRSSTQSCSMIRFGVLRVPGDELAPGVQQSATPALKRPFALPALFDRTRFKALVVECDHDGRTAAINVLRAVMTRLMLSQPPGRVRFVIFDPIGLGENFAGFMHAADYLEELVGRRIWTGAEQIQQQMTDMTEHMENVIQKYLRNEYPSIEAYNEKAGELAEPYRYLVIADFPAQFSEESARRLTSIIQNGARCGVYPLIVYDRRQSLPAGITREELLQDVLHLRLQKGLAQWQDPAYQDFILQLDSSPAESDLTTFMHALGGVAQGNLRVEVPFTALSPTLENVWSLDSRQSLRLPLGRSGATRLQYMELGKGLAQHVLIAGKTGSGKSTLMHVMITAACLWYDPDELELYLVDFKKGVEFKAYASCCLPHLRTVAIESDREFGFSVLQRLNEELTRRGELFRAAGVQDLRAYRDKSGQRLARTLLVVDEFQVFFTEDDKLSHDAAILLEQLVRQGRAFGIHVILGSQTLAGVSALARSTTGQMAVRIALQCAETDSQLILDEDNLAARLLSRPGEAIYNDAGGLLAGNSPFQVAWISEEQRDQCLKQIQDRAVDKRFTGRRTVVFEGNAPAELIRNPHFAAALQTDPPADFNSPTLWLGEPVAIKDPTGIHFQRQSGNNLLVVGQNEESMLGIVSSLIHSLAAQCRPQRYRLVLLDGSDADSRAALHLRQLLDGLPGATRPVPWRDVERTLADLEQEIHQRLQAQASQAPAVYLIIFGLQGLRMLRRQEEDFSFSLSEQPGSQPARALGEIIKEGPAMGVHTILCADTLAAVERSLDRAALRDFDYRALFQMGESDSSNLIDTPLANRLGPYRALLYREALGRMEKFRPYAVPEDMSLPAWWRQSGGAS